MAQVHRRNAQFAMKVGENLNAKLYEADIAYVQRKHSVTALKSCLKGSSFEIQILKFSSGD